MSRYTKRRQTAAGGVALVAAGLLLAACGSSSDSSSDSSGGGDSGGDSGADVAAAQAAVDAAKQLPQYEPLANGGPIPKTDFSNKQVYIVKYADFPYNEAEAQAEVDGFDVAGVKTHVVAGDGTAASWAAAIEAAIAAHADALNLMGMDPGLVAPQVKAAQQAGMIITSSNSWGDTETMPPPINQGGVTGTWYDNGRLYVDMAVANRKGPFNALYISSKDIGGNDEQMQKGFKDELAKVCPGCKVTYLDQPVAKWSELAGPVASELLKNPDTNFIIPGYDSMIPFIQAGINQAGVDPSKLPIVSGNGSAEILAMIKPGSQVKGNAGAGVTWMGAAVATNILRQMAGGDPHIYKLLPRVFDETNVDEVGDPPDYTKGFGDREAWLGEIQSLLDAG